MSTEFDSNNIDWGKVKQTLGRREIAEKEALRMLPEKTRELLDKFKINKQSIIGRVGEPKTDREIELVNLLALERTPGSEKAYLDWEIIIERITKSGNG